MGKLISVEDKNVEIPCTDFTPHIKISTNFASIAAKMIAPARLQKK